MDIIERKITITCGLCKQPGHNRRSYQNRNRVDWHNEICFLLFHCLIDSIVIYIVVFIDLLIVIDCYMLQI